MNIEVPELSLVMMAGASGSGKSTFAAKHFGPTETVASDNCRAMVADDPSAQGATQDAFALLDYIADVRLRNGRLTVADATSVQSKDRKGLIEIAKRRNCPVVAIILNIPEETCQERNQARGAGRDTPNGRPETGQGTAPVPQGNPERGHQADPHPGLGAGD